MNRVVKNKRCKQIILIISFTLLTFDMVTDWINWAEWSKVGGYDQYYFASIFQKIFLCVAAVGTGLWIIEVFVIFKKWINIYRKPLIRNGSMDQNDFDESAPESEVITSDICTSEDHVTNCYVFQLELEPELKVLNHNESVSEPKNTIHKKIPPEPKLLNNNDSASERKVINNKESPTEPEIINNNESPTEPEIINNNESPSEPEIINNNESPTEPEIINNNESPTEPEIINNKESPTEPEIINNNGSPSEREIINNNESITKPEDINCNDSTSELQIINQSHETKVINKKDPLSKPKLESGHEPEAKK